MKIQKTCQNENGVERLHHTILNSMLLLWCNLVAFQ
jgi:hypothetical protein